MTKIANLKIGKKREKSGRKLHGIETHFISKGAAEGTGIGKSNFAGYFFYRVGFFLHEFFCFFYTQVGNELVRCFVKGGLENPEEVKLGKATDLR